MADIRKYSVIEANNLAFGQVGSIFLNTSNTDTITTSTGNFIAITFLTDTIFNSTNGLISEDDTLYPNSQSGATAIDSDGDAVDSATFPKGVTIYGSWTHILLVSGSIIAYVG